MPEIRKSSDVRTVGDITGETEVKGQNDNKNRCVGIVEEIQ